MRRFLVLVLCLLASVGVTAVDQFISDGPLAGVNVAVVISVPTSATTYNNGTPSSLTTLSGTSASDRGIKTCTWTNSLGGSGSTTGTTSWSVSGISLTIGSNVLTVTCTDNAGTQGSDVLTVTRDASVVTVTITTPTSATTFDNGTNDTLATLAGTSSTTGTSISSCSWTNSLGGSGAATGTTSWSKTNIALSVGNNVLTVTCTDNFGVTGNDVLTVSHQAIGGCDWPHPAGWQYTDEGACFPDEDSTGPSGTLTPFSGTIATSSNGQVIQNLDITESGPFQNGVIQINHTNVTISNVRITATDDGQKGIFDQFLFAANYTVDDGEILNSAILSSGESSNCCSFTMRRTHVHMFGEGPGMTTGTVEDSLIELADLVPSPACQADPGNCPHTDGIQAEFGNNVTVRHNTIVVCNALNGPIQFGNQVGNNNNLLEGNLLGGGGYVYRLGQGSQARNNWITTQCFPNGGSIGIPGVDPPYTLSGGATSCGARWYDGPNAGQLIVGESAC